MRSRTKQRRTGLKIRATWHWTHGPTSRAHTQPEDPPVSSCCFALCVAGFLHFCSMRHAMHGPCVRAFLPSFFLPFDSLVPLHTDSEVFPQLLWGWMEEKGRAKWWFQWHSFLPCRSRRARVGVWRYVWESVDGFEAEISFFFLEITFLEQSCVALFSCNWNNGIILIIFKYLMKCQWANLRFYEY